MTSTLIASNCKHCQRDRGLYSRGLCWTCYYTPEVRDQYEPAAAPSNHRGLGIDVYAPDVPPEPTTARPGTIAKLHVLMERLEAGYALWHPDDATFEEI